MPTYILDIVLVAIAAGIIIRAIADGFVKGFLKTARLALVILAMYLLGGPVSEWVGATFVNQPVYDGIYKETSKIFENAQGNVSHEEIYKVIPEFALTDEMKTELDTLAATAESWPADAAAKIATPVSRVISNVIGYLGTFIVAFIVLSIVVWILNKLINFLPILGTINRLLGLLLGVITAFVVCVMISSIIATLWPASEFYTQSVLIKFFAETASLKALSFLDIGKTLLADMFH